MTFQKLDVSRLHLKIAEMRMVEVKDTFISNNQWRTTSKLCSGGHFVATLLGNHDMLLHEEPINAL